MIHETKIHENINIEMINTNSRVVEELEIRLPTWMAVG